MPSTRSAIVCVPSYPEPWVLDVAAEEVTVGSEPGDFGGDDGTAGQDGADLIGHGGAAHLLEVLSNCLESAGIKTELDDGYDVVDVQVVHVGLVAQLGFA